ncbi:hypothetical protein CY34DRAFT_16304 [Suillus luteus UH-Slu-Lm8-n1]|uniref:Uncharacterized protein n=1 Tax=Suillus luteus UH-Slu-Lm8-n1 TaxID=930992 RepID=A0A0D0AEP4_9AGAM|nr:hypothetical protein CY34DRAFT_16304 [Suillus luteus UH-Slu-Lm8-n1]
MLRLVEHIWPSSTRQIFFTRFPNRPTAEHSCKSQESKLTIEVGQEFIVSRSEEHVFAVGKAPAFIIPWKIDKRWREIRHPKEILLSAQQVRKLTMLPSGEQILALCTPPTFIFGFGTVVFSSDFRHFMKLVLRTHKALFTTKGDILAYVSWCSSRYSASKLYPAFGCVSPDVVPLLSGQLLNPDPASRYGFDEVVGHQLFLLPSGESEFYDTYSRALERKELPDSLPDLRHDPRTQGTEIWHRTLFWDKLRVPDVDWVKPVLFPLAFNDCGRLKFTQVANTLYQYSLAIELSRPPLTKFNLYSSTIMHFTALVAFAVVASSVLGSSVPAPTLHSRVIPKRDSGNGGYGFHGNSTLLPVSIVPVQPGEHDQYQRRNSEISIMGRALDSVTTKRDDDSTIHTVLAAKRFVGDVITGPSSIWDECPTIYGFTSTHSISICKAHLFYDCFHAENELS